MTLWALAGHLWRAGDELEASLLAIRPEALIGDEPSEVTRLRDEVLAVVPKLADAG